ncbi:MAG: biotin--[acetyl-CoA-carboxylase] ligase [Chloroflexi bacterium]|nr:biotin--[acetyl-CoA-carboxylase] ligase [Chloroflexota bacterium]
MTPRDQHRVAAKAGLDRRGRAGRNDRLIGRDTRFIASTGSTMDDVAARAAGGAPEGIVIAADEQTAGRGRHDRQWVSAPGDDLLFSVLFRPRPAIAGEINILLALATAEVVEKECDAITRIKWPNDVRVDGAKIAGILMESRQNADGLSVVAGVGLNVNSRMSGVNPGGTAAVSMSDITGKRFDREELLYGLLDRIDGHYAAIKSGVTLVPAWRERIETIGLHVDVTFIAATAKNSVISGVAEGVDQAGRLLVRDGAGRLWPVAAGEVTLHG